MLGQILWRVSFWKFLNVEIVSWGLLKVSGGVHFGNAGFLLGTGALAGGLGFCGSGKMGGLCVGLVHATGVALLAPFERISGFALFGERTLDISKGSLEGSTCLQKHNCSCCYRHPYIFAYF